MFTTRIAKLGIAIALGSLLFVSCDKDDDVTPSGANETSQLFVSNNSDGNVTIYDNINGDVQTLTTTSTAAEGIYYDEDTDEVIQASRSSNRINAFASISTFPLNATIVASISSTSDMSSPRDIAAKDNFIVVADNADVDGISATADGRLFIYERTNGSISLRNVVTTDFAVWGIEFVGNDLFCVVDKTDELAVYTNFTASNTSDATVSATKRIAIEGIVRTHGLAYDNGTMILTDVGDAASDSDGAFHIITGFDAKFNAVANGGTMAVANNQVRVAGGATAMGNPVAAEYDAATNTVFIAEAANGGGRVLAFTDADAGGNITPTTNNSLAKASSLYLYTK